ncbi:hypothetical protein AQUCO_05100020v1 [Aquilegia coerulea]|uniref:Uncharacterized protein n=1 Tax=Aquilegia coerulea TaxID=218851 RepID=A0A2G5CIV1_AQUCA|nr:hypothetical protein AQUCO_05100020v1 [Aquilegia coerulea]
MGGLFWGRRQREGSFDQAKISSLYDLIFGWLCVCDNVLDRSYSDWMFPSIINSWTVIRVFEIYKDNRVSFAGTNRFPPFYILTRVGR